MATVVRFCAVLAFVMIPSVCVGAGTVGIAEIEPLLRQKPQIRTLLMSSLDMDVTVIAAVRFGAHFKHLGGGAWDRTLSKLDPNHRRMPCLSRLFSVPTLDSLMRQGE